MKKTDLTRNQYRLVSQLSCTVLSEIDRIAPSVFTEDPIIGNRITERVQDAIETTCKAYFQTTGDHSTD